MNAIIVDDELNARLALRGILEENFAYVNILDECQNVPEAVISINKNKPDVVFLDISMPGYSGLELFDFFEDDINFKVIFVTAYNEYAINAFEKSAVDYILKPVRISALERALKKVEENGIKLDALRENMENSGSKKVALSTGDGLIFLVLSDIIYLKADGSYTHFITRDGKKITVSKKISEFEKLEKMGPFLRIHRSQMINYNCVKKILKQDGGSVVMDNGDELSISAEKKQALLALFNNQIL
jgi:two-component system, LytTR family, response regulator